MRRAVCDRYKTDYGSSTEPQVITARQAGAA
jgi:hypothetical protein